MLRICTFLFLWFGISLIFTACNGQVPVIQADSPKLRDIEALILKGSYTQKMASNITIPLLVLPEGNKSIL